MIRVCTFVYMRETLKLYGTAETTDGWVRAARYNDKTVEHSFTFDPFSLYSLEKLFPRSFDSETGHVPK